MLAGCASADHAAVKPPAKDPNIVRVTDDQMHQLSIVKVEPYPFRVQKPAIGQIAFNEDASTVVLTPFSGRVTRVIAKIGDDVKRGDPLFEIDSPEVVQAQTDLIAALQGLRKGEVAACARQARARPPDRPAARTRRRRSARSIRRATTRPRPNPTSRPPRAR